MLKRNELIDALNVVASIALDVVGDLHQCIANQNATDFDDIESSQSTREYIDNIRALSRTIDVMHHYVNASMTS